MLVTLTSKGQLTLPKQIRDALKLDAGSKLDFSIQPDGSLTARPLHHSVSAIVGLLHRPGRTAATVEQMNEARDAYLADKHRRAVVPPARSKRAPAAGKKSRP